METAAGGAEDNERSPQGSPYPMDTMDKKDFSLPQIGGSGQGFMPGATEHSAMNSQNQSKHQ